jgi:superfamily II DNA or RNA helicase
VATVAPFTTRDFELYDWQRRAVDSWIKGDGQEPYRGTLEIFTGGGKTIIALACAEAAAKVSDDFRLVVVTPTVALAEQWVQAIAKFTTVATSEIAYLSPARRKRGDLKQFQVLVVVINTARKMVDELSSSGDVMLVVDECHRAGAPTFRAVLDIRGRFKLGLSATPEREEVDEEGEPLQFDEQIVAKRLGRVVFSFDLADARRENMLPEYKIVHHGVSLTPAEQTEYERRSRSVDDATDQLKSMGIDPSRARTIQTRKGELGAAARSYLAAVGLRKDLLYRAAERSRITRGIVEEAIKDPTNRAIVFNERIDSATDLYHWLRELAPEGEVALEHSKLSDDERRRALDGFRRGTVRVLVSAKSLIEGIDVPHANIGVSVASTGSVRQRIQALGRVLRRYSGNAAAKKKAEMHVIYVADTVDEIIYDKEDWSDLTGESLNKYLRWSLDADKDPDVMEGPPRRPKASEDQELERITQAGYGFPTPWLGSLRGQEYRVDTRENVVNAFGTLIANSQGVGEMIRKARGAPGGKFIVTPRHRIVLVSVRRGDKSTWTAAGRLTEPFLSLKTNGVEIGADSVGLIAGAVFAGPLNAENGRYRIRSRGGGCIERQVGRGRSQVAATSDGHDRERVENAKRVLRIWEADIRTGLEFFVNGQWTAWYRVGGVPRFLSSVPNGFEWPEEA